MIKKYFAIQSTFGNIINIGGGTLEIGKELLKGNIDSIILSLLHKEPMYGYMLSQSISNKTKRKFEIKESTLYLALKRLETKRYVSSWWEVAPNGVKRKYYKISKEGIEFYKEKKIEWKELKQFLDTFLEGGY